MRLSTSSFSVESRLLLRFFAAFAAIMVVAVTLSEALIRFQVLPQDSFESHRAILSGAKTGNAAFGDSHTARGFVAGQGFVNLAFPSEGIEHMAWKAKHYFRSRKPEKIILQADPHLFAAYRLNAPFTPYMDLGETSGRKVWLTDRRHRFRLPQYWATFLKGGLSLESKVKRTADGALLSPGDFSELSTRAQRFEARKRMVTHRLAPDDQVQDAQQAYSQMLDEFVANGAEVCLVSYPVTSAYRHAAGESHKAIIRYFQHEAQRANLVYYDARYAMTDQSDFRDADHLNAAGAKKFLEMVLQNCFGGGRARTPGFR